MKLLANEIEKAEKMPFTAQVLQVIGISQFVGASWLAFALTGILREQVGPVGVAIGVFLAIDLGISASLISFVLARVVTDLHAIRWNTDSYTVKRDKEDYRLLNRAIDKLSANIEWMIANGSDSPYDAEEEVPDVYDPDSDPYDDYD